MVEAKNQTPLVLKIFFPFLLLMILSIIAASTYLYWQFPLLEVTAWVTLLQGPLLIGLCLLIFFAGIVSYFLAYRFSIPLTKMSAVAHAFAEGDFSQTIPPHSSREISTLAHDLNKMASALSTQIQTIENQHQQVTQILAGLSEGVMALDEYGTILFLNARMAQWLELPLHFRGQLNQNLRLPVLSEKIALAQSTRAMQEFELTLYPGLAQELFIRVAITPFLDTSFPVRFLVVFNDLSQIKKLETLRRNFVANVSHELKTPLTAIRGFAETLLDEEILNPATTKKFLSIIAKQALYLESLIADLLTLSRVERSSEVHLMNTEVVDLTALLNRIIENSKSRHPQTEIQIDFFQTKPCPVKVHPLLFEQAIYNLVDNAIKYGTSTKPLQIGFTMHNAKLELYVRDFGPGIEAIHLPRLFERFYRIDSSRSRDLGGTGLGLAIVKHIVEAHLGEVFVESTLKIGTTFKLVIPQKTDLNL